MAKKFHVNTSTGKVGQCQAQTRCPFGGDDVHYDTPNDARKAYEAHMGSSWASDEYEATRIAVHVDANASKAVAALAYLDELEDDESTSVDLVSSNGTKFTVTATRSLRRRKYPSGGWSKKQYWTTVYSVTRLKTKAEGGNGKDTVGLLLGREAVTPAGPEGLAHIIEPHWDEKATDAFRANLTNHPAAPGFDAPKQ